jgi:hypothetical protein
VGEKAVVSLLCSKGNPNPTLLGFGVISSSLSPVVPAPNSNCRVDLFRNLVVNLLCTFFNFKRKGISLSFE